MKKNIVIYIIIIILTCALTGTITYILVDQKDNKTATKENNNQTNNEEQNNNESEVKQDGVKLLKTYNLNDKIIEEFEITLNGKTKNMKINFENSIDKEEFDEEVYYTKGSYRDSILVRMYYDNNKFNINNIRNIFNENNFKIVKGSDNKSYLTIIPTELGNSYYDLELYIYLMMN